MIAVMDRKNTLNPVSIYVQNIIGTYPGPGSGIKAGTETLLLVSGVLQETLANCISQFLFLQSIATAVL